MDRKLDVRPVMRVTNFLGPLRRPFSVALGLDSALHGYRDIPLSENDEHPGVLRAGDRMPDLPVRQRKDGAWVPTDLHQNLDPSRITLVLALPREGSGPQGLAGLDGPVVEFAPSPEDAGRFEVAFGGKSCAELVRPDGYAGWIGPLAGAVGRVRAYRDRWFG